METPKTGEEYLDIVFGGSEGELHDAYLEIETFFGSHIGYNIFSGEILEVLTRERIAILSKLHEQALVSWHTLRIISHHPFLVAYKTLKARGEEYLSAGVQRSMYRITYNSVLELYYTYLAFGYPGNKDFPFNNMTNNTLGKAIDVLRAQYPRTIPALSIFPETMSDVEPTPPLSISPEAPGSEGEKHIRMQLIDYLMANRGIYADRLLYIARKDNPLAFMNDAQLYIWAAMHDITLESLDYVSPYFVWLWPGWLDIPVTLMHEEEHGIHEAQQPEESEEELYGPAIQQSLRNRKAPLGTYRGPRIRTKERLMVLLRSGYRITTESLDTRSLLNLRAEEEEGISIEEEDVLATIEYELKLSTRCFPPILDLDDLNTLRHSVDYTLIYKLLHIPEVYASRLTYDGYIFLSRGYTIYIPSLHVMEVETQKLRYLPEDELSHLLLAYHVTEVEDLVLTSRDPDVDAYVRAMQSTDIASLASRCGMIIPPECTVWPIETSISQNPHVSATQDTSSSSTQTIPYWRAPTPSAQSTPISTAQNTPIHTDVPGIPQLYFLNNIIEYAPIIQRGNIPPITRENVDISLYTDPEIFEAIQIYVPYMFRHDIIRKVDRIILQSGPQGLSITGPTGPSSLIAGEHPLTSPSVPSLPTLPNLGATIPPIPRVTTYLPYEGQMYPPALRDIHSVFVPLSNNVGGVLHELGTSMRGCTGQVAVGGISNYTCYSTDEIIRSIYPSYDTLLSGIASIPSLLILSYRFPSLYNIRRAILIAFKRLSIDNIARIEEEVRNPRIINIDRLTRHFSPAAVTYLDNMLALGQEIVRIFSQQSTEEFTSVNSGQSTEEIPAGISQQSTEEIPAGISRQGKLSIQFVKYYRYVVDYYVLPKIVEVLPTMKYSNNTYSPEWLSIEYLLMFIREGAINPYIGKLTISTVAYYKTQVLNVPVPVDINQYAL